MKKLLYLYNDGHRAFPHLGRGGLGYKPPIKIIGGALHDVFVRNGKTKEYVETIDDLDESDNTKYEIDYGSTEHGIVVFKRADNLLLEKARKRAELQTLEDDDEEEDDDDDEDDDEDDDDDDDDITKYVTEWSNAESTEKTKLTKTFNKKYNFTNEEKKEIDKIKKDDKLQLHEKIEN